MKTLDPKFLFLCFAVFLLAGCFTLPAKTGIRHEVMGSGACRSDQMEAFLGTPFQPARFQGEVIPQPDTLHPLKKNPEHKKYTIRQLVLSSTKKNNAGGNLTFYQPIFKNRYPVIVLLPISGGDFFTKNLADYFARNGFGVLRFGSHNGVMKTDALGQEAIDQIKENIRHYLINIHKGIAWLLSQPGVDNEHIGLLGISEGAIVGSLVAATNRHIQAGVFILGGGNLSGIFHSSREKVLVEVREKILGSGGISIDQFHQKVGSSLSVIDPLTYANCIRPSTVLFVDALLDRVIHPRFASQLWEKMGRPERIRLLSGHYTTVLYLPYLRFMALRHFKKIMGAPDLPSSGL